MIENNDVNSQPPKIKIINQGSSIKEDESNCFDVLFKEVSDGINDIGKWFSNFFDSLKIKLTYDNFLEALSDKTDQHILNFQKQNNCYYIGGNIILKVDNDKQKLMFNFEGYFNQTKDGKGEWNKFMFDGNIDLDKFKNPNEPQIEEIRKSESGLKLPVIL